MTLAIKIESVSKLYRLGEVGTGSLAHDINRWWHRLRGKEDPYAKIGQVNDRTQRTTKNQEPSTKNDSASPDYVWALRDVSFDVKQGEVLGIIGRNGAGKSTLLKILSRVTQPTTGSIRAKGRIASLLEVGTGFHPELTGRENIYLNGAILGMRRDEITRQLDEIVQFSGCAKYLDTPVKRYSSGMMVRLGFAVAAHLQCEILIIDEVLAVGDWDFQKKCIEKMRDVANSGRTLLFVSHNLGSVRQLCTRSIIMNQGHVYATGNTNEMIDAYLQQESVAEPGARSDFEPDLNKPFQLLSAYVADSYGKLQSRFACNESITVHLECESRCSVPGLYGYMEISRSDGSVVLVSDSFDGGQNPLHDIPLGHYTIAITIPMRILGHGRYNVYVNFTSKAVDSFNVDSPGTVASFQLYDHESRRGNDRGGILSVAPAWELNSSEIASASARI